MAPLAYLPTESSSFDDESASLPRNLPGSKSKSVSFSENPAQIHVYVVEDVDKEACWISKAELAAIRHQAKRTVLKGDTDDTTRGVECYVHRDVLTLQAARQSANNPALYAFFSADAVELALELAQHDALESAAYQNESAKRKRKNRMLRMLSNRFLTT